LELAGIDIYKVFGAGRYLYKRRENEVPY